MKHLCVQLLSMLSLVSFWKMYPWIRGSQGAMLMNESYRNISYTVLWWPSSYFMKDRRKVSLLVSSCAWMSCRKEVENYYRCSLLSLCKTFGEIKTAKTTICPDLQFWYLKELSVFQNCPTLHVLRPFCSELHGGFTGAFVCWGLLALAPLRLALAVHFPEFQNLFLQSFDNMNKAEAVFEPCRVLLP